jgi:DNA polymerase
MKPLSPEILYLKQLAEFEPEVLLPLRPHLESQAPSLRILTPEPALTTEDSDDRVIELMELDRKASGCTLCPLSETRHKVVFGVGNPKARLMFVGEAPGADEDRQGEPFVGRAGQLLDKILAAMKLNRKEVYIANVLKCRPPGNRNPQPHEAVACLPYLKRQIDLIAPDVIVALGHVAATHLMEIRATSTVKDARGRIFDLNGKPLIVTYHPAALLRNPALKAPTWEDMQKVMKLLSGEITWQPSPVPTPGLV